jgi:hypothetical protein
MQQADPIHLCIRQVLLISSDSAKCVLFGATHRSYPYAWSSQPLRGSYSCQELKKVNSAGHQPPNTHAIGATTWFPNGWNVLSIPLAIF